LAEAGVPAICIETRHAKAFLKAQVNKSDRNDARGIAQMMRVGLFQPVHVKTLASQKRRALLAARKILQEKALAIENDIRGLLRNFGLKVGIVGVVGFEQRIHDLVEGVPELADIMEPLLAARRVLRGKFAKLHRKVLLLARDNEVCQRLMTIPGVGPVVSLAFISTVDVPARFRNSKAVGPSLGLTPVLNQSGESHRVGRISLCGDEAMRALLYEAAQVMLTRVQKWSWLKAWAMNIAKRRGQKKAIVALARRLAVIMHRMWSDGTEFRWTRENGADNLSDERQTVGATKPQSSATMSLAGRWMRRVRFGLLCRSLYRDQYASQIVPSLPADPMLGEPAADPEEKRGPASDKNWSC
jgi:transposase